jgi:hypothetical protein
MDSLFKAMFQNKPDEALKIYQECREICEEIISEFIPETGDDREALWACLKRCQESSKKKKQ